MIAVLVLQPSQLHPLTNSWSHWEPVLKAFGEAVSAILAILGFLGVGKFLIEPRQVANDLKKKYATALWVSCKELREHLAIIRKQVTSNDIKSINSLKKLPDVDFGGRADWFTKTGYYATITAYKIALVSSWLQVYQQELLFSTARSSRSFFGILHERNESLKVAFSTDTRLWADYFDAIGSKMIDASAKSPRPLDFAGFAKCYFADSQFRAFYDQLHMFIWFLADENNVNKIDSISKSLDELMLFLEEKKLLAGLSTDRKRSSTKPQSKSAHPPDQNGTCLE